MDFAQLKAMITEYTGLEKDALHIHVALGLYLVAMFALRQTRRSRFPWLFVLAVELGNQAYDLWHQEAHGQPARWDESLKDLWSTTLWPTVLLLIGRHVESSSAGASGRPPADSVAAGGFGS